MDDNVLINDQPAQIVKLLVQTPDGLRFILYELGHTDVAIVTEGMNCGTSRNTGSDKQTYYKLSLSGSDADSVREMASSLYQGQAVYQPIYPLL